MGKTRKVDNVVPLRARTAADGYTAEQTAAIVAEHEARQQAIAAELTLGSLARRYEALKRQERDVKAEIDRTRAEILAHAGADPAEHPAAEYRVVIGRMPDQRRFNIADFRADNPADVDWIEQWFDDVPGAITVRVLDRK